MILSWTVGKSQGITHELTGMPGISFLPTATAPTTFGRERKKSPTPPAKWFYL